MTFNPSELNALYINGKWHTQPELPRLEVHNPFDHSLLGTVPHAGEEETDFAIVSAAHGFHRWRDVTAAERAKKLRKVAELCITHQDELATLITLEQGKPIAQSRGEIQYGASYFEWFAEEGRRAYGEIIPATTANRQVLVMKQPTGVCAAITPWNFPHAMVARKAAAAMAAGCCIVIKPAAETPFSALAIAKLCEMADIPAGVINIVTGESEPIAKAIMRSPTVRKLSFTGSTPVGQLLMRQSADTLKKLTMELGGNAPYIIFADADLDLAAKEIVNAKFRNSGQTCVCANRILIEKSVASEMVDRIVKVAGDLKVGNGLNDNVQLGPLISKKAKDKVQRLIDDAVKSGAKLCLGSNQLEDDLLIKPRVLTGVTGNMEIWQDEVFGPVVSCTTFESEEQAVKLANDSEHGLAAYFFTKDLARAMRVAQSIESGMVGVNTSAISFAEVPFGGVKESGFGREGGRQGLDEYLNLKYVALAY